MCGRKTLTKDRKSIVQHLAIDTWKNIKDYVPNYNIAPGQISSVVIQNEKRIVKSMRWGLVPSWANNESVGYRMINARAETLTEKPSYQGLVPNNRCVVIADGYYEWMKTLTGKKPYHISMDKNQLFAFAGIWEAWKNNHGEILKTF